MIQTQGSQVSANIIIVGLGPGSPDLITQRGWQILQSAEKIYLRTDRHPIAARLAGTSEVHSFDALYQSAASFEEVYQQIVDQVLELGQRNNGVVYGVPGHPFVAEATSAEIVRRARQAGLRVEIVDGLSFLGPVFSALEVDPFPRMSLVDAIELGQGYAPSFPADAPAVIAQVYSRAVAAEVKLVLMSTYPDDHPVRLIHAAGSPEASLENLALYEIDRSEKIDWLTCLYVPELGPATSFEAFQEIIARLRSPEGCPWDREQTHLSLRTYLLEETYETLEALEAEDPRALQEELGDLLIQIVLHSQIASEYGEFNMADVLRGVHKKLVYRHPHVFGDVKVSGSQEVKANWERLKVEEKSARGESEPSILDGVAGALPALALADAVQKRTAKVGFDWPALEGVEQKVVEEFREVGEAPDRGARERELGDLLFSVVNLARWHQVDPELALRSASLRFMKRFQLIERQARTADRKLADFSLEELNRLWEKAKIEAG